MGMLKEFKESSLNNIRSPPIVSIWCKPCKFFIGTSPFSNRFYNTSVRQYKLTKNLKRILAGPGVIFPFIKC